MICEWCTFSGEVLVYSGCFAVKLKGRKGEGEQGRIIRTPAPLRSTGPAWIRVDLGEVCFTDLRGDSLSWECVESGSKDENFFRVCLVAEAGR